MVLLDTDVMIDLLSSFAPATVWLASLGTEEVVLPGFVVLELLQGCRDKAEQDRVERTVARCRIIWPDAVACNEALISYAQFHLSHSLGFIYALIAHTALMLGQPLYTFNQKHYAVVTALITIQPYVRSPTP